MNKMNSEQRVAHLWKFATSLDTETHVQKLIKSNLVNHCRKIVGSLHPNFSKSQMCPYCAIHWEDNKYEMKLKPQGLQITTNKARKLIDKLKQQENCPEQRLLTKKQKTRAKWLLKRAASKLEINCEFCKHKTQITLDKTNKEKAAEKAKELQTKAESLSSKVAEKGKKKKKNNKNKKTILNVAKIQKDKQNFVPKVTKIVPKSEPTKTKSKQKVPPPKTQSKTQKQNSLLQLAALLKSQDKSTKNVKNNLNSFLE